MTDAHRRGRRGRAWAVTGLVLGLLAASVAVPGRATVASGTAGPEGLRLHRAGRWIEDEHGRVVLLRGVNVVWKAAPYVPPDAPGGLTDADMALIAAHGFDVVRLGVAFAGIMPSKGVIDHAHLDAVAGVVDRLAAHGLYVLLDLHQDLMGAPWGNGFPDWAIHHEPLIESVEPNLGFPLNAIRPSHNLAWDFFWRDGKLAPSDPKGVIGYLSDAVGALADRLGSHPALAGIEIINEPWPGTLFLSCAVTYLIGCPQVDGYVQRTWQRLTDRIRSSAPDVLVWWEPTALWNVTVPSNLGSPPFTPAITDPQVAFAFHDYCGFGELTTYTGAPEELQLTCDHYHDAIWRNAATMQARTGMPNLVTEFGNNDDPVELDRALRRADAALTGWQFWHYGSGFGLRPDPGDPLTETQRRHIVRTYPKATAGIPRSLSFDPASGVMRFTYTPLALGAPTEIAVSDVHYPGGYDVVVTGGHVTSPPGAPLITVDADPDASTVAVTVFPTGA